LESSLEALSISTNMTQQKLNTAQPAASRKNDVECQRIE
jgi:hypothetical protein